MKYFLSLLCIALLCGCGGGGKELQSICVPDSAVSIQLFGDSTQLEQGAAVQDWMNERYGVGAISVTNYGVSGTTLADFPSAKVEPHAISVVNYGINDYRVTGNTADAFKARMSTINPTVMQTPNPPIDGFSHAIRELAAERVSRIIDVSSAVRAQPAWQTQIHDGVHPNAFLYAWITYHVVGPALAKLVDQRLCTASLDAAGTVLGSNVRIGENSASIIWGVKNAAALTGQIAFVNSGNTAAALTFSGLTTPFSFSPQACTAAARGGRCIVTVTMDSGGKVGGQGTQVIKASGASNGEVIGSVWGNLISVP